MSTKDRAAVILMYHDIVDERATTEGVGDPVYNVSLDQFSAQMQLLREGRYSVISLSQFVDRQLRGTPLQPRTVILTFDDGYRAWFDRALPVLQAQDLVADFFLTVEFIGEDGYLTWDQARALLAAGMGIGSHLSHHIYLDDVDSATARSELAGSKELLERQLGASVKFLAPPGGRITKEVETMAAELGYRGICNSRIGLNRSDQDPYRLSRVPIVRKTSLDTFRSIVDQDRSTFLRQQAWPAALGVAKRVLGNERYDRVRDRLLTRRDDT